MVRNIVKAIVVVAAMVGVVGLAQTVTASASKPANNATLKVHEQGTPSGSESNDPKVCVFNFEGFQFDSNQSGLIVVEPQGKDSDTTDTLSIPFGPTNESGYAETAYINNGGAYSLDNGHYKTTIYGKDTHGDYTVDLKAKSKNFKVDCEETVKKPNTTFSWKCVEATKSFVATFTNSGDGDSAVSVNDQNVTVTPGETKDVTVVTGDASVQIKVTVDGEVVFDRAVSCVQGQGSTGGTVTTNGGQGAATTVTSLPFTGSAGSQLASLIAIIASVATAIAGYVVRSRTATSL